MNWQDQLRRDEYEAVLRRNHHIWNFDWLRNQDRGRTYEWWKALISANADLDPGLRLEELRCGDVVWQLEKYRHTLSYDRPSFYVTVSGNYRTESSIFGKKMHLVLIEKTDRNTEKTAAVYDVSEGLPMQILIRNIALGRTITEGLTDVRKARRMLFVLSPFTIAVFAYTLHAKGWLEIEAFDAAADWLRRLRR